MKNIRFYLSEDFQFLAVKFSIYLNRSVFVMEQTQKQINSVMVVTAYMGRLCPYGVILSMPFNHIRHYIKTPYVKKCIKYNHIPYIFRENMLYHPFLLTV